MTQPKIMIGIPTRLYADRADFYDYLNTMDKSGIETVQLSPHGDSPAESRNCIFEQAQIHKCTHILLIDNDCVMRADALKQLLEHDKDIVSGIYYRKQYPHQPLIFDKFEEDGSAKYYYFTGEEPRLIKIAAAGFGFCLIKTSVLDKLEKPYVRLGEIDPDKWCDDIGFFWRVHKAGIEVYCDTECLVGHIGTMILWPHRMEGRWVTGYDTNGKGMVSTPQLNPSMMIKEGISNAIQIEGWMSEKELTWLAKTARTCMTIVEFGSHMGRSTRALGDNCPGVVYAVDPWNGEYFGNDDQYMNILNGSQFHNFEKNLKDLIVIGKVVPYKAHSYEFTIQQRVDMLFIDGDHRPDSVRKDIEIAQKMVKKGGIIAGHDYNDPEWPGVKQVVDEIFGSNVWTESKIWYTYNGIN